MDVSIKDIFEAMPSRFNSDAAAGWNANIQFNFDEGNENWYISIADGTCSVGEGAVESPSATIDTQSETWVGMITGSVNPMQAFMSGKIKITGNMADVMKLQNPTVFARA
jgi:putative sterol carrier protein